MAAQNQRWRLSTDELQVCGVLVTRSVECRGIRPAASTLPGPRRALVSVARNLAPVVVTSSASPVGVTSPQRQIHNGGFAMTATLGVRVPGFEDAPAPITGVC